MVDCLVQKEDWKTHRLVCKPVAVATSTAERADGASAPK